MTEQEKLEKEQLLKSWASDYIETKQEAEKYKKQAENLNANIKQTMELLGKDEVELDDGSKVVYSISTSENLDEDKLIVQLHKYAPDTPCIKTKEYIDMDVLESEIYHEKLSSEALVALDMCRTVKETPKLIIKKAKRGK